MNNLIRQALNAAGYNEQEATEANLIECFTDYVDHGTWSNIDVEDIEDLTVTQMAKALIRL